MSQHLAVAAQADSPQHRGDLVESAAGAELETELVDPFSGTEWDRAVLSHSESNVFHLAAWARVLQSTYGHKPFYLRFVREGNLAALLPIMEVNSLVTGVRGVSLPFSDFCNPLVFDRTVDESQLLQAVTRIALERKWRYFESRSNGLANSFSVPAQEYFEHELDLAQGNNRLFASFAPSVRRAFNKATKSGLDVEVSETWQAMLDFYRLHALTRRRHGAPPQPLSFFRSIHREIIRGSYGFVVVAKAATCPVAAAVFFHSGYEATYKFGASDYRAQRLRANNLVMWKAIEHLVAAGFRKLRFGRTEPENEGLRRFKRSWGTFEHKIGYFRFPGTDRSTGWRVAFRGPRLYARVFRNLPLVVNQAIGKAVYPHLD